MSETERIIKLSLVVIKINSLSFNPTELIQIFLFLTLYLLWSHKIPKSKRRFARSAKPTFRKPRSIYRTKGADCAWNASFLLIITDISTWIESTRLVV